MTQSLAAPPPFLESPCPDVWQWGDDGEVAQWNDGSTAIFSANLALVIERLANSLSGLPPLTSMLFVFAATQQPSAGNAARERLASLIAIADVSMPTLLNRFDGWLRAVGGLPTDVRTGVANQANLLAYLLADCPHSLFEAGDTSLESVLDWLRMDAADRPTEYPLFASLNQTEPLSLPAKARLRRALSMLDRMAARPLDAPVLELLRRTGLEELPEPIEIETPTFARTGDLLRELRSDAELGKLAQAALAVAATISLPRRMADHDTLPAGGVSDVTNRGTPEQLLISELAQEPMALLARIATGQALYLRRESPPTPQPQSQAVLLEAGIRTWGKRRLQIASVAMGLTAALERRSDVQVLLRTVAGDSTWEEDFTSRAGLMAHLERLSLEQHPGPALLQQLQRLQTTQLPPGEVAAEPIVVMTAETDADPEFQHALRAVPRPFLVLRLQPDQRIELLHRTATGDQPLQSMRLDPIDGESDRGPLPHRSPSSTDKDRPLFLDMEPSPLRFSHEFADDWCCLARDNSLWLITHDARLLWYPEITFGGIELARGIRKQHVRAHRLVNQQLRLIVAPEPDTASLWSVDASRQTVAACPLELRDVDLRAASFSISDNAVWLFHKSFVSLLDPESGRLLARQEVNGQHVGESAVRCQNGSLSIYHRAAGQITSQTLDQPLRQKLGHVLDLRYPSGHNPAGMVVVSQTLRLVSRLSGGSQSTDGLRFTDIELSDAPAKPIASSSDGQRLLFEVPSWAKLQQLKRELPRRSHYVILSIEEQQPTKFLPTGNTLAGLRELEGTTLPTSFSAVRKRLTGIEAHRDGLILYRSRSRAAQLTTRADGQSLRLLPLRVTPELEGSGNWVPFGNPCLLDSEGPRQGPRLRRADLPGGTAWLDSRGLLHLRLDADRSELTLVLHDEHLAGWSSQGEFFGSPFFIGMEPAVPVPQAVRNWLETFNRNCL